VMPRKPSHDQVLLRAATVTQPAERFHVSYRAILSEGCIL
jgi:hypothetical protein